MGANVDEAAIVAAVKRAEEKTSGQIVCMLARQSCDASGVAVVYSAVLAFLAPWPLLAFTVWPAQLIFAIQVAVFALVWSVLALTPLGVALIPRADRRRQAFRLATEQFFTRGVGHTSSRAGVLIFVSVAERYARILPDVGLAGKITEQEWRDVIAALVEKLRQGKITEGFVAAVDACGALMARVAPPNGGANDLPDGLVQLD